MPFHKGISNNYQFQIITNFKSIIGNLTFDIRNWKFRRGFTLIELLVVITIFVLTSSLVMAGYLTFERNQRLKNAAAALKSNIRLTQNKALTGDKAGVSCAFVPNTLVGWYIRFQPASLSSYSIGGDYVCGTPGTPEYNFGTKAITFPKGVTFSKITYGTTVLTFPGGSEVNILFRPLSEVVSFHSAMSSPNFLDDSGALRALLSGGGAELRVELSLANASGKYEVRVRPTGEVYEVFVP